MAKRKKRSRGRKKIPLAAAAGVAGALIPIAHTAITGNLIGAGQQLVAGFTGLTPQGWNPAAMATGVLPIVAGALVSMAASKLGINRYLSGIPLIKV